jgi:glutamate-1-semialdehyde 2,1-aminomutase
MGVPDAVRKLTHKFTYNDLDSLKSIFAQWPAQVAAVIMEPMNSVDPLPGFLESVKELAHQHGALLIFDETITGFRFANGGAQEYFRVTPDLATFGKGIANGYPLSAVVGPDNIMHLMEEIFFSFTFGGETLSLAASLATLQKLSRKPILRILKERGTQLKKAAHEKIKTHGIGHILSISGHPSWSFLTFHDSQGFTSWQIKTLFLQEVLARGILILGTHNMSYGHSMTDISRLLKVYDVVFPLLKEAVDQKHLPRMLRCKAMEPLFKIR